MTTGVKHTSPYAHPGDPAALVVHLLTPRPPPPAPPTPLKPSSPSYAQGAHQAACKCTCVAGLDKCFRLQHTPAPCTHPDDPASPASQLLVAPSTPACLLPWLVKVAAPSSACLCPPWAFLVLLKSARGSHPLQLEHQLTSMSSIIDDILVRWCSSCKGWLPLADFKNTKEAIPTNQPIKPLPTHAPPHPLPPPLAPTASSHPPPPLQMKADISHLLPPQLRASQSPQAHGRRTGQPGGRQQQQQQQQWRQSRECGWVSRHSCLGAAGGSAPGGRGLSVGVVQPKAASTKVGVHLNCHICACSSLSRPHTHTKMTGQVDPNFCQDLPISLANPGLVIEPSFKSVPNPEHGGKVKCK